MFATYSSVKNRPATQARSKERPSSEATTEALGVLHHARPLTVVHESTAEAHVAVPVPDGGRSAVIRVLATRPRRFRVLVEQRFAPLSAL